MKDLLSYKSIRTLQIAEKLINTHDYISYSEFQELNNCSNKTVYDDIQYLKETWDDILELDIIINKVRSKKTSVYDLMKMKRKMFHDEIRVKLIINVFFNPYLDMLDHSLMLEYSDSHLRSQVKQINKYLKLHNLSIEFDKSKKGYYIKTESSNILVVFISELIKVSENEIFLQELSESEMSEFNKFTESFTNFVPKLQLRELLNLTKIQKTIMTQQNLIFGQGKNIKNVEKNMKMYNETYITYLKPYMKEHNMNISEEQLILMTDIFVILSLKLQVAPKRVDNFLNRYDYFYDSFSEDNPHFVEIYENALIELHKKTNIDFRNYKTELLFHIYTHVRTLRDYKEYYIGVYSDLGSAHIESIILSLAKNFSLHHFERYSESNHYDLILTTSNDLKNINLSSTNHVKIADYITHQDIFNIYQKIYITKNTPI